MITSSVKPRDVTDISPHVSLYSVGDEPQWVGQTQNMLFRPCSAELLNPNGSENSILLRRAFTLERPIVGPNRIVPTRSVGQVAVLATVDDNAEYGSSISSTVIPYKAHRFTPTHYAVYQSETEQFGMHLSLLDTHLYELAVGDPEKNLKETVCKAIFELINSEQLARKNT